MYYGINVQEIGDEREDELPLLDGWEPLGLAEPVARPVLRTPFTSLLIFLLFSFAVFPLCLCLCSSCVPPAPTSSTLASTSLLQTWTARMGNELKQLFEELKMLPAGSRGL